MTKTSSSENLGALCAQLVRRVWPCVYGADPPPLDAALELIERVVAPPAPGWSSLVSDDHTPIELSIAQRPDGPELRLLFEVPGAEATAASQGRAARALLPWLVERFGADTARLEQVAPLFLPDEHEGAFGLWYAAIFARDGSVRFKAYLDPHAHGRARAAETVERAMAELGLVDGWDRVARLAARGPALDPLTFFSLDLVAPEAARTKIYVSKHDATFDDLRAAATLAEGGDPDALAAHVRAVTGIEEGLLSAARPMVTCLGFVGDDPHPRQMTVHVPVRAYAPNDAVARDWLTRAFEASGCDGSVARCALEAFARRPLEGGSGMIPYVSHSTTGAGRCVTLYLATEWLDTHPPHGGAQGGASPDGRAPGRTAPEAVRWYADNPIAHHPFLQRLAREPLAMPRLALILLNFQHAITNEFSRRLAHTVARTDNEAVRSILAKQLNDELGDGDPTQTHRLLFDRFVDGMRPYAPEITEQTLAPGARLGATLEALYVDEPNPWIGVGATLLMEVFGQQTDSFLGDQFRRQSELPESVLLWLSLHEELEHDHVDEVFALAEHIPEGEPTRIALQGVQALATAGWAFFDDMYRLAWPA